MLQGEHSAILSTFIKLPFVIQIFVLPFLSDHFTQILLSYLLTKTGPPYVLPHMNLMMVLEGGLSLRRFVSVHAGPPSVYSKIKLPSSGKRIKG